MPLTTECQEPVTKIFIIRHADRDGQADDLSAPGNIRATELKRVLSPAKIDSIYSTNFTRTKKTAKPLAIQMGLPIKIYSDVPTIINQVIAKCKGKRVLIVAHSDTVDDLIRQCGCNPPPSIDPNMPSTQFDNLFMVLLQKIPGQLNLKCETIHMKYGAITN